eukprot:CAMPEP_0118724908 /NCGR_PEP_ID=MMETSP0800-20121206/32850_1 /TAXON_ID=210618 ORGANISM="Striatella unipunctata, Strain CCMP2910" /NCGR_SAMPLE_ID=MMETSP0800 /ASSEMBLY_ACC=CAM_ASM_000638 /LENGTH=451 /DNA_ID=CAMNT_0006633557 /DNA_START=204 /DNA_END=1559 /DNA_ORIENTATION=-
MLRQLLPPEVYDTRANKQLGDTQLFSTRPLSPGILQHVVEDVRLLYGAFMSLKDKLDDWSLVERASKARALHNQGTAGRICFDVANAYRIASYELMQETRPGDILNATPVVASTETSILLSLLPYSLSKQLQDHLECLSDIVLDIGRTPLAWVSGQRMLLGDENEAVEVDLINNIVDQLGGFGTDNRAGLERQLHRISAIRNRRSDIIGLTLRVGRHVSGNANMIADLLFGCDDKSILILGEPGSGKTTIVREVTRLLARDKNVCIVDTSNEIAGDGDVPHPCVGFARRMMVPSLDQQSAIMIECVQNHTPGVMVIDEIGRNTEVEAARTCKNRGVRLIASVHGSLRNLIKNPELKGLIGGVESVTLGDAQARMEAKGENSRSIRKVKAERAGPPTFELIVELERGQHHVWHVVTDAANAVDCILNGQKYVAQQRVRDSTTGSVSMNLVNR